MRTRRRTYTLPVSGTKRRKLQSCTAKAKGNRGSKKSKRFTGLWDLNIPSDLLQEILSRLVLKANIRSSVVCKAWCEAAVSVRKSQRRPLLFNAITGSTDIELADPLRSQSQRFKVDFPRLRRLDGFSCSKDGWVILTAPLFALFLNPFTNKHFYLPDRPPFHHWPLLTFSAAPTSSSCVVVSFKQVLNYLIVHTWRPGESTWTTHRFEYPKRTCRWEKCVSSNGVFYCLDYCDLLGVFDPGVATWNVLPLKPCPAFAPEYVVFRRLITDHEGDIFVIYTHENNSTPTVFKLNLQQNVWEEKRDLGGLTVFTSVAGSFVRAGLSAEERNRVYPAFTDAKGKIGYGMCYSLGDGETSNPPPNPSLTRRIAWVEPPHNYVL